MPIFEALSKFVAEARDPGMTSLELRSNPLENPAVPLSSPALWQWMTGGEPTASGETVNDITALQITTVYRCVRFIAESIASLPLEVWQLATGGREKAIDDDVYYLLATEPNPEMSAFTFKETWFGCCSLTGNGYAQIERNGIGRPVAFWPLHPHKTKPIRVKNLLMYETSDGMPLGETRQIAPEDMLHIPLFSLGGVMGLSPVGLLRQSLGLAKATEKFGARFFGNGSRPGGAVFNKGPKPDPKVQKEIIESWNQQHGGTNQGKTAFLFGGEWDYKQIGLSPEDSQFLATRMFQRADIAAMWGLPPHYVGDTGRMSGNNAEQEGLRVVTDTFRPYLSRGENEIDRKLMPRQGRSANKKFVKFDVSERLRGDFKTQQEGFAAGVQWGWFSPNDVRKKLGENPGPKELDVYRTPVNMQNAELLLQTESIQDQPVGADPNAADPNLPTPQERNLLGSYTQTYIGLFRDAFSRCLKRSKRDHGSISACFQPVLRSIADLACDRLDPDMSIAAPVQDSLVEDVLRGMEKRAAKWSTDPAELEACTATEFLKAVRSIHINASREISAARAAQEVQSEESN
jgi:HK97 family phage portal protein